MRSALFLLAFLFSLNFQSIAGNRAIPTTDAVCLACDLPGGMSATNLTDSTATLSWDAVPGATQYNIEIEDEQNNPSTYHIETTVGGTSYSATGLKAGVKYKFKVRTRCGGDKSDWSGWTFFVANGGNNGGGNGACSIASGLSVVVNGASGTLSWGAVAGASKYTIEVEDEQNNPGNFKLTDTASTNSYVLNNLQTGVLYKFKVRTHCAGGQSDWSNWLFFNGTTGGGNGGGGSSSGNCSAPKNAKALDITLNSALLMWDSVPGAGSYLLEIERNSPGVTPWKITQFVTTNTFTLTGLDTNRRYKFKVRANCSGGGHSDWSKWLKFQTLAQFTTSKTDGAAFRSLDLAEGATGFDLQVSPNPAKMLAMVRLTGLGAEPVVLRMLDLTGRIVQTQTIQPGSSTGEIHLHLENIPDGLYLLQTTSGKQAKTLKLVVAR